MRDYPRLGALIFGEGVLNDVLSVVLFKSLLTYLKPTWYGNQPPPEERGVVVITELFITVFIQMVAACIIGLSCGLLNARFLKTFPVSRRHPVHQTSLVLLFGLLSYSLAEVFGVSGILSLFVAAVTLAHYSWHSLSKSAQISTKLSFNAISDIAEGFAFAYVGLSMWQYTSKDMSLLFSVYMLCIIILVRVFTIMTLCYVCKPFNSDFDLPVREQLGPSRSRTRLSMLGSDITS
jgi:sodium/hydrogen exchanger-like protein 6/7